MYVLFFFKANKYGKSIIILFEERKFSHVV